MFGAASEFYRKADVELAACEIVRYGVLQTVHIRHPVVAVYIADVEQVEYVDTEPCAFENFI